MSLWESIATVVTILLGLYLLIFAVGTRLASYRDFVKRRQAAPPEPAAKWPKPSLDDPAVREQLRMLIDRHGITGSVDIRDGMVRLPAVMPGRTSAMAHALMGVYNQTVMRTRNPNLMLYTKQGEYLIPLGIELSMLQDIAELLEAKQ